MLRIVVGEARVHLGDPIAALDACDDDRHQAAYSAGIAELVNGNPHAAIERFRESRRHTVGYPHLEAEAPHGLTLAVAAANSSDASETFLDALRATSQTRLLSHLWMVVETLAIHWSDRGRLHEAAVLLGALEAHGRRCVFLESGRKRAEEIVARHPAVAASTDLGRPISRAELTDHAMVILITDRDDTRGTPAGN